MLFTTRKLSSKRKKSNNEYYPQIEEEEYSYIQCFSRVENKFLLKKKKSNSKYYSQYLYLILFTTQKLLSFKRKKSNSEYYPQIEEEEYPRILVSNAFHESRTSFF